MGRRVRIGYIDRVWYKADSKEIVGDMGFTFCDSADTRVLENEIDNLYSNLEEYVDGEDAVENEEVGDGIETDFAIYELHTAVLDITDDEENEGYLWSYNIDPNTDRIDAVFACAEKRYANEIIRNHYVGVEKHFREEE